MVLIFIDIVAKNLLLLFKTEKTLLFATSEFNNHKEPHLVSVVLIST